jgi:hypothetical protein
LATLDAVLERLTYVNDETGYTVARVATERGSDLLTVVGALLGAQPGESLRLHGRWSSHPRFGRQFEVDSYTTVLPATIQGIQRYLGSGLVKGIGPVFAERIVGHFGLDTLRVIEEEPGRLIEVPGLGPKRTAKITAAWEEQKAIKEVMVFLQGVGVSTSLAVKIFKKYGDASISVVRNEPYRLAADVWGIGFKTADTIAQAVGIPHDSPARVKAGLQYTLSEATDGGHCYLPQTRLAADAVKILDVPAGLIGTCLDDLVAEDGVVRQTLPGPDGPTEAVYLVPFHRAETSLAASLLRLLRDRADRMPHFTGVDWDTALAWLRRHTARYFGPFHPTRRNRWVYGDRETGAHLHQYAWTPIVRHVPVIGRHSPDDPALAQYWADRRRKRKPPQLAESRQRALRAQHGQCPLCGQPLLYTDRMPDSLHQWETWYAAIRKAMTHQAITERGSARTTHRLVHAHCARRHPDDGPQGTDQQADACPPTRAA